MSNFADHPNYDAAQEAAVAAWVKAVYNEDYWAAGESMQASWWVQYLEHLAP
jgi:hypothetical protein